MHFGEGFVDVRLQEFKSSKEFLQAVFDAFIAHKDAYEKCGILHRDISAGNVLLKPGGGGILNDWDLAIEKGPRQLARSGTWQYMSANLCMDPSKISTLQDDLESFYWLVLYFALRYMTSNIPEHQLPSLMAETFDSHHTRFNKIVGGQTKLTIMQNLLRTPFAQFEVVGNPPITSFLIDVQTHFDSFYSYLQDNDRKVYRTSKQQGISIDAARTQLPVDISKLSVKSHAAIEASFTEALSKTTWPQEDKVFDRLAQACKNLKRPLSPGPSEGCF